MYEVRWAQPAVADLQDKVRTTVVRCYLLSVGRLALDRVSAEWGGRLDHGLWWRRGVTPSDEEDPDGVPGGTDDHGDERPYEYVLVYVWAAAAQMPRVFLVVGVLTNAELLAGSAGVVSDGRAAPWLPAPGPPRGRRLNRPGRGGGADRR